jgi:DNA-directed RNA polymerase subunit RPC12/RpoP
MTIRTSTTPTAWAMAECTDCGHHFGAWVRLSEGKSEAYIKCGECGHINDAEEFTG